MPLFKSELERTFYNALKQVFSMYVIYPNVALSNIFRKEHIEGVLSPKEMDLWWTGSVDFVVYDQEEGFIAKYFFEVDSPYHDTAEAHVRDNRKNKIFEAANISLFRIRPESDSLTLKYDFESEIRNLVRSSK